jgi:hypothetical protein
MSLIRDGEVAARVAEWEAARECERRLIKDKMAGLKHGGAAANNGGACAAAEDDSPHKEFDSASVSPGADSISSDFVHNTLVSIRAPQQMTQALLATTIPASLGGGAFNSPLVKMERRLEQLDAQVGRLRVALMNTVDENRFLRLEVDVLREAVLGSDRKEAAQQALELIGRRAGTQDLRDSVCTHCLQRARCFRCYACRSVEYCSAQCQMQGFPAHIALCRHISERGV